MVDIPTTEPTKLVAGDSWAWRREDLTGDYPASSWSLVYQFIRFGDADDADGSADQFTVTASADGDNFAIAVASAVTTLERPGAYKWFARVNDGSTYTKIGEGLCEIEADFDNLGAGVDLRSFARKMRDALQRVFEGRATATDSAFTIKDRSITRLSHAELLEALETFEARVANEENAAAVAAGRNPKRHVRTRFT